MRISPLRIAISGAFLAAFLVAPLTAETADARDRQRSIAQLALEVWQTREGLPQDSVTAIVQTPDGYLWLGTHSGLVRFDGVRFKVYDRRNVDAFENHHIRDLAVDTEGRLWIGTRGGGLLRLEDGRFTRFGLADGLPASEIRSLCAARDGSLWIGTYGGGAAHLVDGRFEVLTTDDGLLDNVVLAILEDRHGAVWIGTQPGGLNRVENGRVTSSYTVDDGLSSNLVMALAEDETGDLWVGTIQGLNRFRDGRFEVFGLADGLSDDSISRLLVDREGTLWLGTWNGGVNRFRDGRFSTFTSGEGLPSDWVTALFEDPRQGLWVGMSAGGLGLLRKGVFRALGEREGLAENHVLALYPGRDGSVWIGTWGGGLQRYRQGRFEAPSFADDLDEDFVGALVEDSEGRLWIGTPRGVYRHDDGELRHFTLADGLAHNAVFELAASRDGAVWVGTNGGLSRRLDGHFESFTAEDGLAGNQVRAIHEDRRGRIYIGTTTGLSVLADDRFVASYTTADGLGADDVQAIHEDGDGSLWLATSGGGLSRLEDGEVDTFTLGHGLPDENLCWLTEDERDRLWVGSSQGFFRLEKSELEDVAAGHRNTVAATLYDIADGLRSSVCSRNHGAVVGEEIWFPTTAGIAAVDPHLAVGRATDQDVQIEEVRLDGREILPAGELTIPPRTRSVEIRYTVLGAPAPRRARFRYRLEGFDEEWVEVGSRREAYYSSLPPGPHRFRVQASRGDGTWDEAEASLGVFVQPAFHQTYAFWIVVAGLAAFVGWAGHRLQMRSLEGVNRRLLLMKEEMEVKNLELETKNAELERFTYTVSHDLKSPLVTIQGFLGLLKRDLDAGDRARVEHDASRITEAADTMRRQLDELLELSRVGRVVNPTEQIDLGAVARQAVALLQGAIVANGAEVRVAEDMPRVLGDRPRILEVFQNLIENAVRYGGSGGGSNGPARVEIGGGLRDGEALCSVRDNGPGIDPRYHERIFDLFEKLEPTSEGTGIGLSLVRRIVEFHGGRVWVESAEEGEGSAFFFTLPRHDEDEWA